MESNPKLLRPRTGRFANLAGCLRRPGGLDAGFALSFVSDCVLAGVSTGSGTASGRFPELPVQRCLTHLRRWRSAFTSSVRHGRFFSRLGWNVRFHHGGVGLVGMTVSPPFAERGRNPTGFVRL